jgi:L-rhamnose isomerase
VISDKLSSVLMFVDEVLLHVSRGVRWDSDPVVTLTDELRAIMQEIVRGDFLELEVSGDYAARLALLEALKDVPFYQGERRE